MTPASSNGLEPAGGWQNEMVRAAHFRTLGVPRCCVVTGRSLESIVSGNEGSMAEARLQAADDRDRKPDAHDVGSDAGNDLSGEAVEDRFVDLADRTPGSGDDPGGRRGWAVRGLAAERRDRAAEERELAVLERERAAEDRDRFAAERDECAEERDQVAA